MSTPTPPKSDDGECIVRQDGDKRDPSRPHGNSSTEGNTSGGGSSKRGMHGY